MIIFQTVSDIEAFMLKQKSENKSIGFVPTMGALHEGHISLVRECIKQNDECIVSIFVNPTQFNNKEDLEKYPRDIEKDVLLLEKEGVNVVFAPSVNEIYPEPDKRQFDFGQLDKVMEGKFRPGHFNGVAQVVSRLFDIIKPNKAYFGEKDFQQLAIIRELVNQYKIPIAIIGMPILREKNGLAMSSRNERLTNQQRTDATNIYGVLKESKRLIKDKTVKEIITFVTEKINKISNLDVEYFDIIDGYDLQPIQDWKSTNYAVGCIAVFCGDVRLIDNVTYYNNKN